MEQPQVWDSYQMIDFGSTSSVFSFQPNGFDSNMVIKVCQGSKENIEIEAEVLESLSKEDGFPLMISRGQSKEKSWIVMEKLGVSLKNILKSNCLLSVEWVVKIGLEMLHLIEKLHQKGYLHKDLKPQHFLLGTGDKKNFLHLIDFGMAQKIQKNLSVPKPSLKNSGKASLSFKGNIKYSSVEQMLGHDPCCKDELISLVFIIAELLGEKLPWSYSETNLSFRKKYMAILHIKQKQNGWGKYGWWVRDALKKIKD